MTEVVEYNYVFVHFDALLCQLKGTGKQFNARLKAATSFARRSQFSEFFDRHHARPAEALFWRCCRAFRTFLHCHLHQLFYEQKKKN